MTTPSGFFGLGIAPNVLSALTRNRFTTPTPIQAQAIPVALQGKDLIGLAQTGTGKTLAFGVPLLQAALDGRQSLVVLPTRELAVQVVEELTKLGKPLGVRCAMLIGGESLGRQAALLKRDPKIIVGTPGRIIDHLEQRTLSLASVRVLVLDEADRMLDMGFEPQLRKILHRVPKERQTLLFSATMPKPIVAIAQSYMQLPTSVEIARPGTITDNITQELFFVSRHDKARLLEKILRDFRGSVLVFSRTKFGAKKIAANLRALGYKTVELHSNRTLAQRRDALEGFKNGRYRILVATDIAARGIDVKGIEVVINYDLPDNAEDYVHRIGRTARAGASGRAISFAMPEQRRDVQDIERLMKMALKPSELPELPPARTGENKLPPVPEPRAPRSPRPFARHQAAKPNRPRGASPARRPRPSTSEGRVRTGPGSRRRGATRR